MKSFQFYKQHDAMDCGPTCLQMVSKYYGKNYTLQNLRLKSAISREGVSMLGLSKAAENLGFRTLGILTNFEKLASEATLPIIIHWRQNHFAVVHKIEKKGSWISKEKNYLVSVADPAKGLLTYSHSEFLAGWLSTQNNGQREGVALLLEPTANFYELEEEAGQKINFERLFNYLFAYKKLIIQLILGLLVGSALQLIFPFLTQSIVDVGINTQNLNFIYLVLLAQLMLFAGRTTVEFIRSWILLHISTRINLSILSDFLFKLMQLPLSFFDTKLFGDLMQRINDHQRIEQFLTNTTLTTLFSLFNLVTFSCVLAFYHLQSFIIFLVSGILYIGWVMLFLSQRRKLDFKRFAVGANNQSSLVQLIQGMQEIKLANCEMQKRWKWEHIQAQAFKLNIKNLALNQYQQAGAFFLNDGKNILITFLSAKAVIEGQLTLGAMMAIQFIIGQLNSPIEQLIRFLQTTQDAKISMERLNEIHQMPDEEPQGQPKITSLPANKSINLKNVFFQYVGAGNEPVIKNLDLYIPEGKTTAIVGMSGSGKTTLLKILLKFYEPQKGEIRVGDNSLNNISHQLWRSKCGVVMQDGFIFSDTIANNIAVGEDVLDIDKLMNAVKIANIHEFIQSLPLGYNTKIGAEGNGISQGQKQRLLIARAAYKDPSYIFFDEATNALDAINERVIMNNLSEFFLNKTVVIVAHRLSTVKNADNIVVLNQGEIVEQGTHHNLTNKKGDYFHLVKNQLELGV